MKITGFDSGHEPCLVPPSKERKVGECCANINGKVLYVFCSI